jgi:hypothetical protein
MSQGRKFRAAVERHGPLQIPGAINAYCALLAARTGFKALYLSGAGVANASFGLPDLGITTLNDVLEDARRITAVSDLPLLVDADTGWGGAFGIARTTREMIRAGVAAMHIEDQEQAKRCGHRPGKAIVATAEMCDRLKAAVDARTDEAFRSLFNELGGFDEAFYPVWFEDVDFCLRAAKAGYCNWYEPASAAIHEGGHSVTRVTLPARQKYWYGSLLRFAKKHFDPYSAGCIQASSAIGLALRGIASSFSARRRPERQAYFQAMRMILTGSIANSPSEQSEKGKKQTFTA